MDIIKKLRYVLLALLIALDQGVKYLVRLNMVPGESSPVIKNIFHITYVQNKGVAFSLFSGQGFVTIIIPLLGIIFAIYYMERHGKSEHWTLTASLLLIASGGLGNIIDRLTMGFVTDMFDFRIWPVFNVADIAICVGACVMVLYVAYGEKWQKKRL